MTKSGQSLFELVVAIGIVGLILLALVSLSTLSVKNASYSRNQAEAARVGQEAIEWLRGERDKGWAVFVDNVQRISSPATRCFKDLDWAAPKILCDKSDQISNLYYRKIEFTSLDLKPEPTTDGFIDLVEVVITIYWKDGRGDHEIKNSTNFTDWRIQ